jgi:hypothetical protein
MPLGIEPSARLLPLCPFEQRSDLTRTFAAAFDNSRGPDLSERALLELVRSGVYIGTTRRCTFLAGG